MPLVVNGVQVMDQPCSYTGGRMAGTTAEVSADGNAATDARYRLEFPPCLSALAALSLRSRSLGDSLCTDHQGRRRFKKVYTWDEASQTWVLSETHTYLCDQWNVVCERVTDAASQTTTHSIYTWGLDLSNTLQGAGGVGGLLAAHTPDGDWFYCYDGNGNITTLVSTSDGSIQAQYDYSPFGLTVSQSGPAAEQNLYRFSTKPLDETQLYYYGFRYYNPTLGRWMSRDPIGEKEWCTIYGYLGNSVVGRFDLFGLESNQRLCNSFSVISWAVLRMMLVMLVESDVCSAGLPCFADFDEYGACESEE